MGSVLPHSFECFDGEGVVNECKEMSRTASSMMVLICLLLCISTHMNLIDLADSGLDQ